MPSPREIYGERLAERERTAGELRERERTISGLRLAAVAFAIGFLFWKPLAALVPAAVFIVLVVMHERILRRRRIAESGAAFYRRGMARMDDAWAGSGDPGTEFLEEHHPYAADLDLFGKGSLFELVSVAVTRAGRRMLAGFLKQPTLDTRDVRSRQEAVLELRDNVTLREDLTVEAAQVAGAIDDGGLESWASHPPVAISKTERLAVYVFPILMIVALGASGPALVARFVGWTHPESAQWVKAWMNVSPIPLLLAFVAVGLVARHLSARVDRIVAEVENAEPALALLARVIERLEREPMTSAHLSTLQQRLRGADRKASAEIDRLRRLVGLLDARRNQMFAPFAVMLLWTPQLALAIERWRARTGSHIGTWIAAVAEIEALSSLASFAFEHPSYAMPELVPVRPCFEARALGHPLIPQARRVSNDLRLNDELRLVVISGSNMSGKSTMMRSVGLAAVLAMAGGPVCAASFRFAPASVGASISVHDSLQENASRFYAEILRIRQIIELSRQGPLLFLLDEVLAGTNSHDRRIGAEAIVRGLVERNAVGLISTHDLALAEIAESLAPRASNVHFEDRLEDGRVIFDYRMRPGVVTRSNALELMRSVGIEV